MADAKEVLNRHIAEIRAKRGVLNVAVAPEFKDGQPTGKTAITVYVEKKLPMAILDPTELLPESIEDVPIDVVSLNHPSWTAGKTSVSELHPDQQRGLLKARPTAFPVGEVKPVPKAGSLVDTDLRQNANPIQDQQTCGFCTDFGSTGVMEAEIKIKFGVSVKLSEQALAGGSGATCDGGNTVEATVNWLVSNGTVTEACCPYQSKDVPWGTWACPNPDFYKLDSWSYVDTPAAMAQYLQSHPLIATMAVHQSFFNYTGGVYQNLGPQDPIVGYHCIGAFGDIESLAAWLMRNSWGPGWGEAGYFRIKKGDSEIDSSPMFAIIPAALPGPVPPPPPAGSFSITTSAGPGGQISPSGNVTVTAGADQTFAITPNTGYHTASVVVDGNALSLVSSYTFKGVSANHSIGATFQAGPSPSPCIWGNSVAHVLTFGFLARPLNLLFLQERRHRIGRFMDVAGKLRYMNP